LKLYAPDIDSIALFNKIRTDLWGITGILFEIPQSFTTYFNISEKFIQWLRKSNITIQLNYMYCKPLVSAVNNIYILESLINIETNSVYLEKLERIHYNLINYNFSSEHLNFIEYFITLANGDDT
jgi:hypothetical protein